MKDKEFVSKIKVSVKCACEIGQTYDKNSD